MRDLKTDNDVGLPVPAERFQIPLPTSYVLDTHAKTNVSTFYMERTIEVDKKTKLILFHYEATYSPNAKKRGENDE